MPAAAERLSGDVVGLLPASDMVRHTATPLTGLQLALTTDSPQSRSSARHFTTPDTRMKHFGAATGAPVIAVMGD